MNLEQNFGENKNEAEIAQLLEQRKVLQEQLAEIDKKLSSLQGKDSADVLVKDENKLESGEVKYFGNKNNKTLEGELSNDSGATFKVFNINGNRGEFEYCGPVRNENWFESVARITNGLDDNLGGMKKIISVKSGTVRKNGDKWEVDKPVEIKFTY